MSSLRKSFALLVVCLSAPLLASDPAYLVRQINQTPMGFSSYPAHFVAAGNAAVFNTTTTTGTGLDEWRTDGTEAGTVKIGRAASSAVNWNGRAWMVMPLDNALSMDVFSIGANETSAVHEFTFNLDIQGPLLASSDHLYFFSNTRLWRSDGTLATTAQVGTSFVEPWQQPDDKWWAASGQTIYFIGYDRTGNADDTCLFRIDNSGLTVVENFGFTADRFKRVTIAGPYVYFVRYSPSTGTSQLWRSDGTSVGTTPVKTAQGGTITVPYAAAPLASGSSIYFVGDDGGGSKLWRSDGTDASTTILATALPGVSSTFDATLLGFAGSGSLVFTAAGVPPAYTGIWAFYGGTATFLVESSLVNSDAAIVNGIVVFGTTNQLWRSDGTVAGTFSLADVSSTYYGSYFNYRWPFVVAGTTLYFGANDTSHGFEPWKTGGSLAGTSMIKDLDGNTYGSQPASLQPFRGGALFTASSNYHGTYDGLWDLWFSDGTEAGTQPVLANSGQMFEYAACGDRAYFAHPTNTSQSELWSTDGTAAGTALVKEIYPNQGSYPHGFACVDGITYFFSRSSDLNAWELWRTDGTSDGTLLVKAASEIGPSVDTSTSLVPLHHAVYFGLRNSYHAQLWRSDGTPLGTVLVKDIPTSSNINFTIVSAPNGLYFTTSNGNGTSSLWISDGTAAGTIVAATDSFLTLYGDFYGRAVFNSSAAHLAVTDGTTTTTFDEITLSGAWTVGVLPLRGRVYYNLPDLRSSDGVAAGATTGIGAVSKLLGKGGGSVFARRYLVSSFIETSGTPETTQTILSRDVTQIASSGGRLFIASDDLYAYDMPVAVTSFAPDVISGGGVAVNISGRGFTGPVTLTVGGIAATVTNVTDTSITFTAPSLDPGAYAIAFTLGDGREMTTDAPLTYTCTAPVAAIAPVSGVAEAFAAVTLSGSGGTTCMWFPETGLDDASSCTTQAHVGRSTTYTLIVYSDTGCPSTNNPSVRVRVSPPPPSYVQAYPNGGNSISVSWPPSDGASSYEVWRRHGLTDEKIATTSNNYITDSPVSYLDGYVYRVKAVGADGTSVSSSGDYSSTYSYATVAPAVGSPITAWSITTLRGVIDMIRVGADLNPFGWSQSIVAGETVISAADVLEMRTALDEVAAALSVPTTSWTGTPATDGRIRASYIVQIRNATR